MEHAAVDLFDFNSKNWLVMIDRFSGFPWTEQLNKINTEAVTAALSRWFMETGWSMTIRCDGGP